MQIENLLYDLSKAKNPTHILVSWSRMGTKVSTAKAIIAIDDYEKSFLPSNIVKTLYSDNNDFVPYFQSSKLYFIDNEILNNMLSSQNNVEIPIDYSIMFDTNYASYIHQFVNNPSSNLNNEVFTSIALLLRENYQYDFNFYLIENSKSMDLNSIYDFSDFIQNHNEIYQNIISLELFKSIDNTLFKNTGKLNYTITKSEATQKATDLITTLFCTKQGIEYLQNFTFMQKQMTLFLIGMLNIQFSSNKSPQKKIYDLFDFMNEKVGVYFERESIVAHRYFKEKGKLRIFRKIQKNGDTTKILETINNIAWDFVTPRVMEFFMRFGGEGKFFLPFILSHDAGLKEILQLFNVKACLIDEHLGFIPVPSINTQDYYESENCTIDFESYFSKENKSKRATTLNKNREVIDQLINEECNKLIETISKPK
ncbi:hypothetical protein [Brevibacillus panacihumi]|uniref:Uncharacterized protein n=1 Tax=Brevibacillus panacihumi TaxID=497735 RepID=A0A3M8BV66_9BACL|nr:hypothetical protein [Brevibacillus panacihumi]RNB67311.1 hypothetical protein EDM58_25360 [Brevibacillus panacihumi]